MTHSVERGGAKMKVYSRGSIVDYEYARPEDVDLAVPAMPQVLEDILRYYPLSWVRASSANYLTTGPDGLSETGLMAERGTVYYSSTIAGRPRLFIEGRHARFAYSDEGVERASAAFSAGPMLAWKGRVTDIEAMLALGRFRSVSPWARGPQAAVAVTRSGALIHAFADSLSMHEMASFLIERGALDAMSLSAGVSPVLLGRGERPIGDAARLLPSALVIRSRLTQRFRTLVMLDPGHGGSDPGAVSPTGLRESSVVLDIALGAADLLDRAALDVSLTRYTDAAVALSARFALANEAMPECFVMVHANSAHNRSAHGVETFYWHNSQSGYYLARVLLESVVRTTGLARRPYAPKASYVGTSGYYQGLRLVNAPSAILETGFLSNASDERFLADSVSRRKAADGIASAVLDWLHER